MWQSKFFTLVMLNEVTNKCVIRFGRFVGSLKDRWKYYKGIILSMCNMIGLFASQWDGWIWLSKFVFLIILKELIVDV
jgi:hypothetical protein